MSRPKAYDPQQGYKFQLLVMCPNEKEYEHCDYAADSKDKKHLLSNYRTAYGPGFRFKVETLPRKYWPKKETEQA